MNPLRIDKKKQGEDLHKPPDRREYKLQLMASRKSQFLVIFLTILLSTIGFGVCIPVLPLYAEQFGATEFVNGLLVGVFSLMVFFAAPLWGALSDRIGRRPVLIVSILGSAIGYFIMGWAGSLIWLFIARIIDGLSGGNIATAQAYIADITKPEERSKAMGMIGAAFGLGFIIGPAIGGILSEHSTHTPFYFVGGLCIINALLVYFLLPESLNKEAQQANNLKRQPLSNLLNHADKPLYLTVATTYFLSLAAFSIMTAVFALFAQARFNYDAKDVGYIMAAIGVIGVLIQGGFIRRLLPKYGEVKLAKFGLVALLLSFILLPLVTGSVGLYLVSCLIAVGNSFIQPTLSGLASRSVAASWQGRGMGVVQGVASLGRGLGPILGGLLLGLDKSSGILQNYGRTPFWTAAAFMVLTLILASKLREPKPVE